jgi:alkylation response protein AidB-like acyl-CoA dehydrogenase
MRGIWTRALTACRWNTSSEFNPSPWQGEGADAAVDFKLSTEQQQLKDAAERFVKERCGFDAWLHSRAAGRPLGTHLWPEFAAMGWLALPFAEADGGFGAGPIETMVLMQALGRGLVAEPYLHGCVFAGELLSRSELSEQHTARIQQLLSGEAWVAVAEEAPNASGASGLRAERSGAAWRLSGQASTAGSADTAQALIVAAQGADGRSTVFWVDAKTPGVTHHTHHLVDGSAASTLKFAQVLLPDSARLSAAGSGQVLMQAANDRKLAAMGAEAMGLMDLLLEQTIAYTCARRQFGQPVARFQALRHRMVDMFMAAEQMRSLLLLATMRLAEDHASAARALSAMKVQLGQAGRFISQQAVQLHGGMGMTDEIVIGHAFKRLMVLDAMGGNVDHHLRHFSALRRQHDTSALAGTAQEEQGQFA